MAFGTIRNVRKVLSASELLSRSREAVAAPAQGTRSRAWFPQRLDRWPAQNS
jgi:hypothetical protein